MNSLYDLWSARQQTGWMDSTAIGEERCGWWYYTSTYLIEHTVLHTCYLQVVYNINFVNFQYITVEHTNIHKLIV